jgi:hypothetical protein
MIGKLSSAVYTVRRDLMPVLGAGRRVLTASIGRERQAEALKQGAVGPRFSFASGTPANPDQCCLNFKFMSALGSQVGPFQR